MRHATFLLPLSLLLAGCPAPTDPDLDKPCGARRAATLQVGTGASQFEAVGAAGVPIQTGPQGGNHIWIGVECQGLGPNLVMSYGIKELSTGTDVTGTLESVVPLQYDQASDTDQAAGIYGYFALTPTDAIMTPSQLVGHEVLLWADGNDTCVKTPLHSEVKTTVTGFAN